MGVADVFGMSASTPGPRGSRGFLPPAGVSVNRTCTHSTLAFLLLPRAAPILLTGFPITPAKDGPLPHLVPGIVWIVRRATAPQPFPPTAIAPPASSFSFSDFASPSFALSPHRSASACPLRFSLHGSECW